MGGPWEDYQDGPWKEYAQAAPQAQSGSVPLSPMGQDPNYDVANRSTTANPGYIRADAIPLMQDPAMTGAPVYSGLTGQDKFSGLNVPNAFEEAARSAGPAIGSALGSMAGPGGMVAGAAAGRSIQNLAQNTASVFDPNVQQKGGLRMVGEAAADAAFQKGAEYVAPAMKWAGAQASEYGGRAFDYAAKNLGGMGQATINTLKENAPGVYGKLGITREQVGALGGTIRKAITDSVDRAGEFYAKTVDKMKVMGKDSGVEINLRKGLSNSIDDLKMEFGYNTPPPAPHGHGAPAEPQKVLYGATGDVVSKLTPDKPVSGAVQRVSSPDEAGIFNNFANIARQYGKATPQQVYYFQRDLTAAIRRARGTPLAAALGKLKSATNTVIEGTGMAPLIQANKAYAAAMELEEDTAKLVNADDMVAYIKNAFNPNKYESQKREAIEELAKSNPAVATALEQVKLGVAAEEASPLFRSLPQTGFGAAIGKVNSITAGAIGTAGFFNPLAAAAAVPLWAAANTAFSPRAYATGYRYGPGLAGQASKAAQFAAAQAPKVAPYAAQSLEDLYRRMGVQP